MKYLSLTLIAFSLNSFAKEYAYSCKSKTNLPIFEVGNSQEIAVEATIETLHLTNDAGDEEYLTLEDDIEGSAKFRSAELLVIADSALVFGGKKATLTIIKKGLVQDYKCLFTESR